jgi:hypothetical protein
VVGVFLILQVFYWAALVATTGFVWRIGGRDERIGMLIAVVASIGSLLVELLPGFDWRFHRGGLFLVDLATLVAFFALTQRSSRFWPLWVTAFQLITVTTHMVVFLRPAAIVPAYAIAQGFWAYPILMCMIIGAIGHNRRRNASKTKN